jgi:hypothetical protein
MSIVAVFDHVNKCAQSPNFLARDISLFKTVQSEATVRNGRHCMSSIISVLTFRGPIWPYTLLDDISGHDITQGRYIRECTFALCYATINIRSRNSKTASIPTSPIFVVLVISSITIFVSLSVLYLYYLRCRVLALTYVASVIIG